MRIRKARQMLKTFADDTRLRIINLLDKEELNVTALCSVLGSGQSNMSKHLSRLRLTGVVGDKRKGLNVYYYLRKPESKAHKELLAAITSGLSELSVFKEDLKVLSKCKKTKKIVKGRRK